LPHLKIYTKESVYVGYARYDTEIAQKLMNEMYGHLRLYVNFFLPVMKLIQKTRVGSKVRKKYDEPQTPYQRVLVSTFVLEIKKEELRQQYANLNPAMLRRHIAKLQNKLFQLSKSKRNHPNI
jgi:hypothetical protein